MKKVLHSVIFRIVIVATVCIGILGVTIWLKHFTFGFESYDDVEMVSINTYFPNGKKDSTDSTAKLEGLPVTGKGRTEILSLLNSYTYARIKDSGFVEEGIKRSKKYTILQMKVKMRKKDGKYEYFDIHISDTGKMEIMKGKERSFYISKQVRVESLYKHIMIIVNKDIYSV